MAKNSRPQLFREKRDIVSMPTLEHTLSPNVRLLKAKASKPAIKGTLIALVAVAIANMAACYAETQTLSISGLIEVQSQNVALWFLNLMPFAFAYWGQYVSTLVAQEADTMIVDQTSELFSQTEHLREQVELESQTDPLTGLPNRNQFKELLRRAISDAQQNQSEFSVVVLSINTIQEVNDILGYNQGDELMKHAIEKLNQTLPEEILLGRISGAEFGMIIPLQKRTRQLQQLQNKVTEVFAQPFSVDSLTLILKTSMGSATYPKDGSNPEALLRHAFIASFVSRKDGVAFTAYSPQIDVKQFSDLHQVAELVNAMDQNEFFLQYQPKLEPDGAVREVEVLVRWMHPVHGMIPPDKFIPIIEKNNMTKELLQWVMTHALHQVAHWRDMGFKVAAAINLSALDLLDSNLPQTIQNVLNETGVDSSFLKLEITETTIMTDRKRALSILEKVAGMDINTSIDDFGTGYSSLAYLSELPAMEIKIDRSFVMDMVENRHNAVIVKAIIYLAHNLSMKTVAEGVESQEIMDELRELGCDYQQGYYISRPLDASALIEWLQARANDQQKLF